MALMCAILFVNFFFHPIEGNFIPYFVKTDIAAAPSYLFSRFLTPELWSSVFSVLAGIGITAGSILLSMKEQKDNCGYMTARRLCAIAALLAVLTVCYRFLVHDGMSIDLFLVLFSFGNLMIGLLVAGINIPVGTAIMRTADRDKLSKVTGMLNILSMGLIPVASVAAGAVLQYFGSTVLLAVCTLGLSAAALSLLFNKQIREI